MIKKFFILFFCILISFNLFSSDNDLNEENISNGNTYINSTNIYFDQKNNIVTLGKNSYLNNDEISLFANDGYIDFKNDVINIEEKFYILQNNTEIFSGHSLVGDSSLINIQAKNINYIINENFKIISKNLEKKESQIIFFDNYVTPCEIDGFFNCPTWSLDVKKTVYDSEKDQYRHYDTFLQIADLKLFYIPYISHYGQKAPRKKGFLTPSFELQDFENLNFKINTPYYLPLNDQTDLSFYPTIFTNNFKKFNNTIVFSNIQSSGNTDLTLTTQIDDGKNKDKVIYNSFEISNRFVIDKNTYLQSKLNFNNNISEYNDNRTDTNPLEYIYLDINKYNILKKNDFLRISFDSITAFNVEDQSTTPNSIPKVQYNNFSNFKIFTNKIYSQNKFNISNTYRNTALEGLPNNYINFSIKNYFNNRLNYKNINLINSFNNIINLDSISYESLNYQGGNRYSTKQIISSELNNNFYFNSNNSLKLKLKTILTNSYYSNFIELDEDTKTRSFDYNSIFRENRLNGNNKSDNKIRSAYGIEFKNKNPNNILNQINLGQEYDHEKIGIHTRDTKGDGNFSDFLSNIIIGKKNLIFDNSIRINRENFGISEIFSDLSYHLNDNYNISVNFYKTDDDSFKNSSESQNLGISQYYKVNNNISLSYSSKLDVLDKYNPITQGISININDECSNLVISYENTKYNDLNNTQPSETITFRYQMDYLGFFSYNQNINNLFTDIGSVNYGN
jgi:lipopolysaccharide assembly outer membrane protein LptD (OstA)